MFRKQKTNRKKIKTKFAFSVEEITGKANFLFSNKTNCYEKTENMISSDKALCGNFIFLAYVILRCRYQYWYYCSTRYRRYVNFERRSNPRYNPDIHIVMTVSSALSIDSSVDVIPPAVSRGAREIYHDYVQRNSGRVTVPSASVSIYKKYVSCSL